MIVSCTALWPGPDPRAAVLHWQELAFRAGALNNPLARPCLLAIRGAGPYDAETHELVHQPGYHDTGVLFVSGKEPVVFPMSTAAYQRTSKASPGGAVGSIRPGRYVLHDQRAGEEVVFHVKNLDGTDRIPCWRDYDHDGVLSPAEMRRSEEARAGQQVGADGAYATSILFHGGLDEPPARDGTPAKHRFSIGCLTASRRYRKLVADAARDHGGLCDLSVKDAPELVAIVPSLVTPGALPGLTPEDVAVDREPPKGIA